MNSKQLTVAFSENVQLATGATAVTGVVVKVKGVEVSPANLAVVNGKLSVTTSADFGLADSISVEFKSASLADVNGNKVKDGSVSK